MTYTNFFRGIFKSHSYQDRYWNNNNNENKKEQNSHIYGQLISNIAANVIQLVKESLF